MGGGYNCDMIARCTVECVNMLVLMSSGVAACEGPPLPPAAISLTPKASPKMSLSSPPTSPVSRPFNSPKSSPKQRIPGAPNDKTVGVVRRLTELHNKHRLKLPIAPEVGTPF